MIIEALSTSKQPQLIKAMSQLRMLITTNMTVQGQNFIGLNNLEAIRTLLENDLNSSGEFYKYYWDQTLIDQDLELYEDLAWEPYVQDLQNKLQLLNWVSPIGNNVLLLMISRAAFNSSEEEKKLISHISDFILQDAQKKLEPSMFTKFISFEYLGNNTLPEFSSYDHTPLTLAIKCGMYILATKLVSLGSNVNVMSNKYPYYDNESFDHSGYTPAHLVLIHSALAPNKDDIINLLKTLKIHGADFNIVGHEHRSAKDILLKMSNKSLITTELLRLNGQIDDHLVSELRLQKGKFYSIDQLASNIKFCDTYPAVAACLKLPKEQDIIKGLKGIDNIWKILSPKSIKQIQQDCIIKYDDIHHVLEYNSALSEECKILSLIYKTENWWICEIPEEIHYSYDSFRETLEYKALCEIIGASESTTPS